MAGAGGPAAYWVVGWHHTLERFSARELNGRFRRKFGSPLGEIGWAAWAAVKLVGEAVVRGGASNAAALVAYLESAPPFDGHKGRALTFRKWDHQLRQPLYVIGPRPGGATGGDAPPVLVAELPAGDLDAIGTAAAESRCRF